MKETIFLPFTDIFEDITKYGTKIPTIQYLKQGKYPIIDQGKAYIAGYTNQESGLFCDVPIIIFGDHTRILKFVYMPFFLGADGVKVIKPKLQCNVKYLYYVLQTQHIPDTGYNRHFKWLKSAILPILDSSRQEEVVQQLEKIEHLITKRKQQMQKVDELVKSQFIEMFGEFDLRNRHNDWIQIGSLAEVVGGSTPKTEKAEYWQGEYFWITPAEIDEDSFVIRNTQRKLTEAGVRSCSLRLLPVGTVLLSSRAPIGKVAIAGVEMFCNQGFKNLICSDRLHPIYAYYLLKFNTDYLNSLGRGATFKEISKTIVEKIYIPVPTISAQNEFARFVEQTDKSKNVYDLGVAA